MKYTTKETQFGNVGMSSISQSHADAQAYMMDTFGCKDCKNCWGCENCIGCEACIDCFDCRDCTGLHKGVSKILIDCFAIALAKEENDFELRSIEDVQEEAVRKVVTSYFKNPVPPGYKVSKQTIENGFIPERYLISRCLMKSVFSDALRPGDRIKDAISRLVIKGFLKLSSLENTLSKTGQRAKCYTY